MTKHIMLDLETLGKGPYAVITQIGVVALGDEGPEEMLHIHVDPESCVEAGLEMDASTVLWWLRQAEDAKAAFQEEGVSLAAALDELSYFVTKHLSKDAGVWGNGSDFDNVIATNAYKALGMNVPWPYFQNRCYRTLKNLRKDIRAPKLGVKHNAVHDALSQAHHLRALLNAIK
jgi:hypothetical protein